MVYSVHPNVMEHRKKIAAAMKRCQEKFERIKVAPHDGKKFIPKPERYRVKFWHINDPKHRVTVWALNLDTGEYADFRVWKTNSVGKNKNIIKRTSGPYTFEAGGVLERTKISTYNDVDSVILYSL